MDSNLVFNDLIKVPITKSNMNNMVGCYDQDTIKVHIKNPDPCLLNNSLIITFITQQVAVCSR